MSRILKTGENQITQNYKKGTHNGIDLVKKPSSLDAVIAHSAGKVVAAATGKKNDKNATGTASYGNYVKIDHGSGFETLYAHLASVAVKIGQTVTKGAVIGEMGNTGHSFGAHLHFEVRQNGNRIDPTPYLNADLPKPDPYTTYNADVKKFQTAAKSDGFGIKIDGYWGKETESTAKKAVVKKRLIGKYKNLTVLVQKIVGCAVVDGKCGKNTDTVIRQWQKANGLTVDGCFGPACWKKWFGI